MNYLITGVGGQGTVLASKLIADALMARGEQVHSAETIGMAQRGGSVSSHIRTGAVLSPLIPRGTADVLIAFEPAEAVRCLPYLREKGVAIVNTAPVRPVTSSLADNYDLPALLQFLTAQPQRMIMVDGTQLCAEVGSAKVLNVCLLGVAAHADCLGITLAELEQALASRLPAKLLELNQQALATAAQLPLV